ncbi:MAG: hypothetical protein PHO88_06135 [Clostridia bacterium]|nr:hypothetical protein [Clostridia bacterium]
MLLDTAPTSYITTNYTYDDIGNITLKTTSSGEEFKYTYDKDKNIVKQEQKIEDTNYKTTDYTYNYAKKVTSKKEYIEKGSLALNSIDDTTIITLDTSYEYDNMNNVVKETSPDGIITNHYYDKLNRETKNELVSGDKTITQTATYLYDSKDKVLSKTDGNGNTTTYEYDNTNNLINETTANVSTSSTYNKAGKVATKTDGNGNTTTYEYDAKLNVVKETNQKGTITDYYFDERNNLVKKEIDNIVQEEYTYDLLNNKITEKDELNKVITSTYDLNGNLVKQVNNNNGYTVRNQYTLSKKIARSIDNYDKELLYKYDMLNNVIEETEQKIDVTQVITTKTKYDNLSNKIETTDGNNNVTTYEYDGNNNLIKETNPKLQITTYTYDKNGNQLTETDYLNNTLTNSYDNLDRVIQKLDQYDNVIEKLVYDDLGRQTKSIDANDNWVEYTFDNNNNTLTKKDQEENIETYEYDSNNNKTKYIDKNLNETTYEYNNKNKLTKVINALNESTIYTYDNKGNMLTQKDAANNIIEFVFDINSNEINKIDQLSNEDTKTYYANGLQQTFTTNNGDIFTYTYDIHGRLINENILQENTVYEYDNNDNKTKIGNVLKTYDNLNRILTQTENNQTVTYTYDDTLKTVTITDSKNNVTTEEYDKVGRLLKVTNNSKVTQYVYNSDGSVQKQTNPTTTSTYEYYPDKKIKRLTTKDVNDILIEENYYEYDSNNNITLENAKVFTYDALNRIKTNDGTEYNYDAAGNILSKSILEGTTLKVTAYVYNDKNQLLTAATLENTVLISESAYTYDDNGNQLTETTNNITTTNTYNQRNELTNVNDGQTVAQYTYNSEGKRVQKITDTTTNFVYDGDNIILELDDQNEQIATNTYGLALVKRTTSQEGYYLYNGHGDVTKILDNTNTILNTYVYDNFGKILSETETFNNPFKYAGYYYDKETKTYYLQARYYNPEIQRFISEDTYRGNIDDPLSLNLYTYCANNPMMYTDPSGHFFETIFDIIGVIMDIGSLVKNPSLANVGMLAFDIGTTFIPGVPGTYAFKAAKLLSKADDVGDVAKVVSGVNHVVGLGKTASKMNTAGTLLKGVSKLDDIGDVGKVINKSDDVSDIVKLVSKTDDVNDISKVGKTVTSNSDDVVDGMKNINKSKTGPKPSGTGAHNKKIKEIADKVDDGEIIYGGQRGPEKLYSTKGGIKSGRRPDVVVRKTSDGSLYGINVGKTTKNGKPIKREIDAINDLENFGNMPMRFVPYK